MGSIVMGRLHALFSLPSQVTTKASSGAGAADEDDEMKKGWKFGRNEGPMAWPWKLMCAILYMLPWVDVTEKTVYFIERFPAFHWTEYFTGARGAAPVQGVGEHQKPHRTQHGSAAAASGSPGAQCTGRVDAAAVCEHSWAGMRGAHCS